MLFMIFIAKNYIWQNYVKQMFFFGIMFFFSNDGQEEEWPSCRGEEGMLLQIVAFPMFLFSYVLPIKLHFTQSLKA